MRKSTIQLTSRGWYNGLSALIAFIAVTVGRHVSTDQRFIATISYWYRSLATVDLYKKGELRLALD